jgi:hypothetical protein
VTDSFWQTRDSLEHVLTLARARGAGPWAVLGSTLVRTVAMIPPDITLPGIVGSRMSLNLFVALVGHSGAGKGAAAAAAADGHHFPMNVDTVPLGTGEGIARTYRPISTGADDPDPTTAIFDAPEIDTVAALAARQGGTLSAELRKLYSGEQLGFGNAGKETRVIVPAHSYRACLSIGVQPLRSHTLLGASDGGLPQRFVWLPTSDPDAPDDASEDPGRRKVPRPSWLRTVGSRVDLIIPDKAKTAIRTHRLAVLREDPRVDPLDGHALLTQLKVAAALMALDGRTVIDSTDWSLAGYVMDVSNSTRERCQRALTEQSRNTNVARALFTAEREEIVSDRKHQRCKESILRWLNRADGQPVTRRELTQKIKNDIRPCFDAAIAELTAAEQIFAGKSPRGVTYSVQRCTEVQRTSPAKTRVVPGSNVVPDDPKGAPRRRKRTRGRYRTPQQTRDATA